MAFFSNVGILFFVVSISISLQSANGDNALGVNYGTQGDNLPTPTEVVAMYRKYNINKMRIFSADKDILDAVAADHNSAEGCSIYLTIQVPNTDLQSLAGNADTAKNWVSSKILPYADKLCISTVAVGNEVIPGSSAGYVSGAMRNIRASLVDSGYTGISVTTAVATSVLGTSYPPSQGAFSDSAADIMSDVLKVIAENKDASTQKLLVNVYPYFSYIANPGQISLSYAQFEPGTTVNDQGLTYTCLFDAQVDALYSAIERAGQAGVGLIVSESGWPSAGNGEYTSIELAKTYNTNLRTRVGQGGTPKKPNEPIEVFIFAMFNENKKASGAEQNFGLFYPDKTPVYPFFL